MKRINNLFLVITLLFLDVVILPRSCQPTNYNIKYSVEVLNQETDNLHYFVFYKNRQSINLKPNHELTLEEVNQKLDEMMSDVTYNVKYYDNYGNFKKIVTSRIHVTSYELVAIENELNEEITLPYVITKDQYERQSDTTLNFTFKVNINFEIINNNETE
ncbi:MAG: hypothetical protein IJ966_06785 [Bacilli bacterium]|nr:hypothetical protein [Bacilli bacterium]